MMPPINIRPDKLSEEMLDFSRKLGKGMENLLNADRLALLEPPAAPPAPCDVLDTTERIVRTWEAWVREDPLQWRWIHWRWKTRPGGSEETYTPRDVAEAFAADGPAATEVSA